MPYLPWTPLEQTGFPRGDAKDLQTQIDLIREQYQRFYPQIEYEVLKKAVTKVGDRNELSGEPQTTQFDPLFREPVPASQSGDYEQPHGEGQALDATEPEQYESPVLIHARVQRIDRELERKKYGVEKVRDIRVYLPTPLLDDAGITVKSGDRLAWNNETFVVKENSGGGWWKNTNVRLFIRCECDSIYRGS